MVLTQGAFLLQEHFRNTNWDIQNHYGALNLASRHLLDFNLPVQGVNLNLSQRPSNVLHSSLSLSSLVPTQPVTFPPTPAPVLFHSSRSLLQAQLSYLYATVPLQRTSTKKGDDRLDFKNIVQSFHAVPINVEPELRDGAQPVWLAGKRVDKPDRLLFGRLYFPEPRLDALYVHRLSARIQALVSLISVPSPSVTAPLTWPSNAEPPAPDPAERLSELEVKLQTDTGRWSAEYSYAVGDAMFGAKALYNFQKSPLPNLSPLASDSPTSSSSSSTSLDLDERAIDDEEPVSTGLKGRWSAGGEVYFSAQERAAGLSTGFRFATLPGSEDYQPPTVITATLNPIMGHLSTAYAVQVDDKTSLASRFDFNLYSYDAELTVGGEWFYRRAKQQQQHISSPEEHTAMKRKSFDAFGRGSDGHGQIVPATAHALDHTDTSPNSVIKFRASTNDNMALLWEGKVGNFLLSAGLVADLRLASKQGGRKSPIKSVGLSAMYWA